VITGGFVGQLQDMRQFAARSVLLQRSDQDCVLIRVIDNMGDVKGNVSRPMAFLLGGHGNSPVLWHQGR
jgi:hypothetical protein